MAAPCPEVRDGAGGWRTARCTRCGRPVWHGASQDGRRVALDPDPDPDKGFVVLDDQPRDGHALRTLPAVRILRAPDGVDAWVLHDRTCPVQVARRSARHRTGPRPVRCRRCFGPMDLWLVDVGEDRHPGCLPELDPEVPSDLAEAIRQAEDLIRRADQLRTRPDPTDPTETTGQCP